MSPHWMTFLDKGHEAMRPQADLFKNSTKDEWLAAGHSYHCGTDGNTLTPVVKIDFKVEESSFSLRYDGGWFQLYHTTPEGERKGYKSEFYTLGIKDVHDMADTGVVAVEDDLARTTEVIQDE